MYLLTYFPSSYNNYTMDFGKWQIFGVRGWIFYFVGILLQAALRARSEIGDFLKYTPR